MRTRTARLGLFLLALCLPVSVLASGVEVEKVRKTGISTISVARAKKHVFFLAGMKCQGRASGEAGCDVARDYLVTRLTEYGVEPCGENGTWLQTFPIRTGAFPGQRPAKGAEPPSMKPTSNVIGVVRGSDPELAKEAMILAGKMLTDKDPLGELDGLAEGLPKGRKAQLLVLRDGKRKLLILQVR